jgi:hypothetical protein
MAQNANGVSMKKYFSLFLFMFLFLGTCFSKSLDYFNSGEYAYYHDTRGNIDYLRGYWFNKIDNGNYGVFCRNVNLKTNSENIFYIELKDNEKGMPDIVNVKGINDSTNADDKQSIVDFMNYTYLYINNISKIGYGTIIEDPWDNYTLQFSFNNLLPFFRFLDIKVKGENESKYILNSSGELKGNEFSTFKTKNLVILQEQKRQSVKLIINEKQKKK